ncbi:hypothetical protein BDZ97DRAFT_1984292 [Flammula alnicola]|nr:hypothetical protein BDZ97DRAFT_1984292 [Flammula alnicola]
MPLLRPFDCPRFDTVGECVDFFQQIFKGLQFLHHHYIAHRHASIFMHHHTCFRMASILNHSSVTRVHGPCRASVRAHSVCPPKYYWIDFGVSTNRKGRHGSTF